MTKSKRKEMKIYYAPNSYDEQLIEFIKDYAIARGQSYTEVVLEILRAFWLPIALKDSPELIDPVKLKDLEGKSVGILRSQLELMGGEVNMVKSNQIDKDDKNKKKFFQDSITFDSVF